MAESSSANSGENWIKVSDKLSFDYSPKSCLGKGGQSSVYKGRFENIDVAVKIVDCKDVKDARETMESFKKSREKEIMNLVERERHKNIIGYFITEIKDKDMFLALELCNGHLGEYVKHESLMDKYPPNRVIKDIGDGVEFLHSQHIVHRDLKPENIYYVLKSGVISKIVIGDFGTSKTTLQYYFSLTTAAGVGTPGYIPYEIWEEVSARPDTNHRSKMTPKTDIFAMGCVFYFTITHGKHPFGNGMVAQNNIYTRQSPNIDELDIGQGHLKELLIQMLSHISNERPSAREVSDHPALWTEERIMTFLIDVNDELRCANRETRNLVENPDVICRGHWEIRLPANLLNHLNNYMSRGIYIYRDKRDSVCGLLTTIRNVASHYKEFPQKVLEELGSYPEGHLKVWMSVCPMLLMHIYGKVKDKTIPGVNIQRRKKSGPDIQTTKGASGDKVVRTLSQPQQNVADDVIGISSNQDLSRQTMHHPGTDTSLPSSDHQQTPIDTRTNRHQQTNPLPESTLISNKQQQGKMTARSAEYRPLDEGINRLSIQPNTAQYPSERTGSDIAISTGMPEIVRQTQIIFKPDASYWSLYAHDEIETARQCGFRNTKCTPTVICIDISESMSEGEKWIQVKRFVDDALNSFHALAMLLSEHWEYIAITTFGHETKVIQRLSQNIEEIRTSFNGIKLGGPSPMYGGIMIAAAAAGTPESVRNKPTIAIITDCKPTETTRYAGPDEFYQHYQEQTTARVMDVLLTFKDQANFVFVPVGDFDQNFLELMMNATNGKRMNHTEGKELIYGCIKGGGEVDSRDMYAESTGTLLPAVGTRVIRGPDWKWENQDGGGPGTVVGHKQDHSVWVEWDANNRPNIYRYGHGGEYDVLTTDERREVTQYGSLKVGCTVTLATDSNKKGVVIKIQGDGKVHVRWNNGDRGDYCFGQNDVYDVWPWQPETETRSEPQRLPTEPTITSGAVPRSGRNKNLQPRKAKRPN